VPRDRNDPDYQEKIIKFNELLANCVIYSNACDITAAANALAADGHPIDADELATISRYITHTTSPTPSAGSGTGCWICRRRRRCRSPRWIWCRVCCSPATSPRAAAPAATVPRRTRARATSRNAPRRAGAVVVDEALAGLGGSAVAGRGVVEIGAPVGDVVIGQAHATGAGSGACRERRPTRR
jgi:hypothetical protein